MTFMKRDDYNEIDTILQNHTWKLMNLPPIIKLLDYKWIFKKKMKIDSTIDKYKVRLIIKGCQQWENLDYFNIYSPISWITSIGVIVATVTLWNLKIYRMDVKMTFISKNLEEEIYMEQFEKNFLQDKNIRFCKLVKSLCGLK